jgi:hypothetical protein
MLFAIFRMLDHQGRTDDLVRGRYVQQHQLFLSRSNENWRRRKATLEIIERGLCRFRPCEVVRLSEQPIEGKSFFTELAYKATECC